nr:reverse transcriptase domain-containing protein [Tanacetum cinerariifolium]
MLLHMVTTDMKLLVVEIELDDTTADDVDKVSCSTDVEKLKQVYLKFAHSSIELHLHDIHVVQDKHEVDQFQNSYQFHGLPGHDANKHLDKLLHVTQSIKVNRVTDDAICLYLFPYSLTHRATDWFDHLPRHSIHTFEQMAKMFLEKYFSPFMVTKLRNEITNFHQRPDESLFKAWERYKLLIDRCPNHNVNQQVKAVTPNCETCGGPHSTFTDCPAIVDQTQNVYAAGAYQGSGTLPSNTITNPKENLKGITTRSGTAYQGPKIPTTSSSLPPVVERETETTMDTYVVAPIIEPVVAPVSASKPNQKPSIPYPSRLHDQMLRKKANDQREKFFQIFKDLNFNISFVDALILMPNFGPTIKTLLNNKYKLFELARTLLNEHFLEVLLKKLPEKLGDLGKFLIPLWNKLLLLDLSPTCMTLELADRSISRPVGVAEDVFVKVGTFHFPTDLVVVDFDADPRVPLILERSFLKTRRALIDVFEGELTIRVGVFAKTLSFSDVITSGNPTPYYDLIVLTSSPNLTPFEESDFLLEEVNAFLALEDDPTSPEVDQSYVDPEGDILLLEAFINDDPSLTLLNQGNYLPEVRKELKICEAKTDKSSIDEPLEEKSHFLVKEGIVLSHKISKDGIKVDKPKVDVIAKLPHPTTVKGIRSFLGHAGFYGRFIKDFWKIARSMTRLLEKDTPFFFSKKSVPFGVTRSVPARVTRSVPAGFTRSVPAGVTRSVPAGVTRSVPAESLDRFLLESLDRICKLKDVIKSLSEKSKEENVNYDYGEIETKNDELKNNVAKLSLENERLCNEINHVKHVLKEQFYSIKRTRAEAIYTAWYTQNRSLICLRYNKTPYELTQVKKPDSSFFHVFGALCYPTNDNEDMVVVSLFQKAVALRAMDFDSLVSTSIDQDASSTSIPSSQEREHCWDIKTKDFIDAVKDYYCCWSSWKSLSEKDNAPIVTKTVDDEDIVIPPVSVKEKAQRRDGLKVEHCYADYEGKKIPKENMKEAGHGNK